ncbi:dynein-1-beta heavy chain, flagellar inner arm I1 complex [Fopius arisanus]|uniref:Dynein-1-beta heavy chain, flagellar inner arm I1 complex n=1 Tax=Fopius arisanus TaxID=64838 RepID=A0A9R1T0V6_9HYME|nr:PREDICTED: dynein-1-beta heavy chain, flagellar inner arm I1 complex [Fopius arisanus]
MATARADSIDPKKMRRGIEKAPPPDCRDYLDMDTDEEEFGRQGIPRIPVNLTIILIVNLTIGLYVETPEPVEELPPEPEKPVFTDDELETLVCDICTIENLSCLHHQLKSNPVLTIVKMLKEVNSSSVEQFHSLTEEVEELVAEASSNVMYLNLFVDNCVSFDVPSGIEEYSTKILHQIRFVGLESKFYTSEDKIDTLCRALGTQIIEQCKNYINLDAILSGDASEGKRMLENSINCCQTFLRIFDRISRMDAQSDTAVISKINKTTAFCHVNIFIQRCQDLIEFSEARFVYDTSEEVKMIGGARGMEHELQYKKIEESFTEILEEVKEIRYFILDVTTTVWLDRIVSLNKRIQSIDNMVKNLIQEIFEDVQNIEEGIGALYAMKRFVTRRNLRETIRNYWTAAWKIFDSELKAIDIREKDVLDDMVTKRSIRSAMLIRIKADYINNQFNIMINASDWLGDSNIQLRIIKEYKLIQSALTEKEKFFFSLWEKDVQTDVEIRNILKESVVKFLNSPNEDLLEMAASEVEIRKNPMLM